MTDDNPNDLRGRPKMAHAIRTMPKWKWTLLGFSLVLGCIGLVGQGASMFLRSPAPVVQTALAPADNRSLPPTGSAGFVSGKPVTATPGTSTSPAPIQQPSLTDKLTPFMSKFGFSLFVGVTVGLIFRTFLRMTALVIALIVAAAAGLSYFHINIDMTSFKADTTQASSWMMDQGYKLRDLIFHALPSSTAATVGFFLGFKKR